MTRRSAAAALQIQAALWCVCLALRSAHSQDLYKVGDSVTLGPDSVKEPIASITWKHNGSLALDWLEGGEIDSYRQFKGQATLNVTTAALTLTGLTVNFRGLYELEVNAKQIYSTRLEVISPVSKPSVSWRCDEGRTSCLLSCDGAHDDQVTWRRDDTEIVLPKQLNITKERDAHYKKFSCVLENQVSKESSEPVNNPLSGATPVEGQKWLTGVTVFISLLTVLVVLALVHRWKAGFWFYDTEYMPWEADFWRRSETAGVDQSANGRASSNAEAAASNGTSAAREQKQHEEDGLMAGTANL